MTRFAPGSVLFLSHGGGPLPLLGDPGHREMVDFLHDLRPQLGTPAAIVVISAHWEAQRPTLTGAANPPLIYDYYGFPEESYQIRYPAPGHPALAEKISATLRNQGIDADIDGERGYDHGLFVPLKILYPEANIPCLQLSLLDNLDPAQHIAMGAALAPLRDDNVLIIGSGFSFHNLKAFFSPSSAESRAANHAFEDWLVDTLCSAGINEQQRRQRLLEWSQAPAARYCHPREEHLLPLHVCYGASGGPARQAFSLDILGKRSSAFLW